MLLLLLSLLLPLLMLVETKRGQNRATRNDVADVEHIVPDVVVNALSNHIAGGGWHQL